MPASVSSFVTLTVVVECYCVRSSVKWFPRLDRGLTVTYGIMPDCVANTVMSANSMAGDTSLQPDFTSIYFNQEVLSFKVMGMLRSGGSCITANNNFTHTSLQNVM